MWAIQSGMLRRVAVTYMEWAGLYQNVLVDWHLIEDQRDAAVFAQKLVEARSFTSAGRRSAEQSTTRFRCSRRMAIRASDRLSTSPGMGRTTRARKCRRRAIARQHRGLP